MRNSNELLEYYLEKEGYYDPNKTEEEKAEIKQNIRDKFRNHVGEEGEIYQSFLDLMNLEGSQNDKVDEEQFKKDYENYKANALRILKAIPEDYDLKCRLIDLNIDYDNFDDEDSFEAYRYNRIYKIIKREIQEEYYVDELSWDELKDLENEKMDKYHVEDYSQTPHVKMNKFSVFLDEIDEIIKKEGLQEKFGTYSNFVLGRMYLAITKVLYFIYKDCTFGSSFEKEKYDLLKKYIEREPNNDIVYLRNELGFLSYNMNEMKTYKEVCKLNNSNKKDYLVEYVLKNLKNIFVKEDNDKYIKGIIKRNFFFFTKIKIL